MRLTSQMLCRCQPLLSKTPIKSPAPGSDIRLWKPRCSAISAQRRKLAATARAQGEVDVYTASQPYTEAQPAPRQPCSTSGMPTGLDIQQVDTLPTAVSAFCLPMLHLMHAVTGTSNVSSCHCSHSVSAQAEGILAVEHLGQPLCRWTFARPGWLCSKPSAKQHIYTRLTGAG